MVNFHQICNLQNITTHYNRPQMTNVRWSRLQQHLHKLLFKQHRCQRKFTNIKPTSKTFKHQTTANLEKNKLNEPI